MLDGVGLTQFLPLFALTLIAGAAADRYDRRKILLAATLLQLSCGAALAVIAWSAHPRLVVIFGVAASSGVGGLDIATPSLLILAAIALVALVTVPFAAAAALRAYMH